MKITHICVWLILPVCYKYDMKWVILVFMLVVPTFALAGQQYDPMNNRWVTVPDRTYDGSEQDRQNERVETYNPNENEWSLEKPDAQPEYNPFENKWEFPE